VSAETAQTRPKSRIASVLSCISHPIGDSLLGGQRISFQVAKRNVFAVLDVLAERHDFVHDDAVQVIFSIMKDIELHTSPGISITSGRGESVPHGASVPFLARRGGVQQK
jgi:hypothetical protein